MTWPVVARLVLARSVSAAEIASALGISLIEAMDRMTATIAVRGWDS